MPYLISSLRGKNFKSKGVTSQNKVVKIFKSAVKKIEVFAHLNYPKTCVLSCVTLIYVIDHMVKISTQEENICRTNLFQKGKAAVKKD